MKMDDDDSPVLCDQQQLLGMTTKIGQYALFIMSRIKKRDRVMSSTPLLHPDFASAPPLLHFTSKQSPVCVVLVVVP